MSAFTDFVQLELPKRPYMDSDVSAESIIVRRGAGPRQLQAVTMNDGEVLGMVGGVLQGVSPGGGMMDAVQHVQNSSSATWTITHNKNNRNAVVQLFDNNNDFILAHNVRLNLNDIVVTLGVATTGFANVIFF